ncbi:MAG: alpha/beta hydrolase [Bacteroidota bacterium]
MKTDNKVLNNRLGDIEYSSVGRGVPVLFVHGGHSNCHETLCHQGFDLERFQLITPSRPGYGKTPLNGNRTPKQAADLMVELLNHLKIDDVVVYGISAGGLTAIALAANYPSKVKKWQHFLLDRFNLVCFLFNNKHIDIQKHDL